MFTDRVLEIFWSRVDRSDPEGCWPYAKRTVYGYGQVTVRKRSVHAHRVSWAIHNGPIPKGMFVLHSCDNRPCVNPAHLRVGTHQENMDDMTRRGRAAGQYTYAPAPVGELSHGSKLTDADVVEILATYRRLYGMGKRLADRFGVSSACINKIVTGQTWRHIPRPDGWIDRWTETGRADARARFVRSSPPSIGAS